MKYKRVTVYARRGAQDPYTYVGQAKVKRTKATRVAHDVADDIAAHEGRSGQYVSVVYFSTGAVVRAGSCKFVVRAG